MALLDDALAHVTDMLYPAQAPMAAAVGVIKDLTIAAGSKRGKTCCKKIYVTTAGTMTLKTQGRSDAYAHVFLAGAYIDLAITEITNMGTCVATLYF